MNVAILSPPGCVAVALVPGATANENADGVLITTAPDPPDPPAALPKS